LKGLQIGLQGNFECFVVVFINVLSLSLCSFIYFYFSFLIKIITKELTLLLGVRLTKVASLVCQV